MRLAPTPWNEYETAQFRLAGFGGAAVYMRTCVLPGLMVDAPDPVLAMDIGFLSPDARHHVLARPIDPTLPERLARFFFAVAEDYHPELSVDSLQDDVAGLVVSVESSDDDRVCLNWSLVEDLEADVREFEGLNFETSRAALVTASQRALDLTAPGWHPYEGVDY